MTERKHYRIPLVRVPQALLTAKECADIAQIHVASILKHCQSGQLPHIRLGNKSIRIERSDFERFLQDRKKTKPIGAVKGA